MLHRSFDDDDGLQTWLVGHPGWPLVPPADTEPEPRLEVRVIGGRTLLHAALTDLHLRANESLAHGDLAAARRARQLADAVRAELRP